LLPSFCLFFFFQAEDGIRDVAVTGVQTCALPISMVVAPTTIAPQSGLRCPHRRRAETQRSIAKAASDSFVPLPSLTRTATRQRRSEERRVGKECRSRWSPYH